jgi:hypothetical protein
VASSRDLTFKRIVRLLGLALAALLASAPAASAATYTANVFTDTSAAPCAPDPAPANCELRGAVSAARNSAADDTIVLLAGIYKLGIGADNGVNSNINGDLDYADIGPELLGDLTILGKGPNKTAIDATGTNHRILQLYGGGFKTTIKNLRLTGGDAGTPGDLLDGGALFLGDLSPTRLENVWLAFNHAADNGGALATFSNGLELHRVTVSDSNADDFGGGIWAKDHGPGGSAPTLSIYNSTISGNQALQGGGGIAIWGDAGPNFDPLLTLSNSTVAGNRANAFGGGIDAFAGAKANITFATIVRNTANADNVGSEAGGGLQNGGLASGYAVDGSVIALNKVGSGGVNPDCSGSFGTNGGNVLGDPTGCTGFTGPGDVVTPNPMLGPLADNGGPTETVALLPASAAIDHNSDCPTLDQRGLTRDSSCDTGAYELVRCGKVAVNRVGTSGRDKLIGTAGRDGILGLGGKDVLRGKRGSDGLCGGGGRDRLIGGGGRDLLLGQAGPDLLLGGAGRDRLFGGRGRDRLRGGRGRDRLRGGPGKDKQVQ